MLTPLWILISKIINHHAKFHTSSNTYIFKNFDKHIYFFSFYGCGGIPRERAELNLEQQQIPGQSK